MCIRDSSNAQLTEKIGDINIRIDTLENNFKQALHEQVVRIENKQKELHLEWRKDLNGYYINGNNMMYEDKNENCYSP